jgi:hypothetical protein
MIEKISQAHGDNQPEESESANHQAIKKYYKPIYDAVEKMKMDLTHLLFIKGRAGIGKSYNLKLALQEFYGDEFFIANRVSEAYLFRILYENNGKPIWLRDCLNLLRGQDTIEMLKSASETNVDDRIVTNYYYSRQANDLPQQFCFTGQLIFDFNQVVDLKYSEDFNALISRGEFYELVFSFDDICRIMLLLCKKPWQRQVTEWLIANCEHIGQQFHLRTQQHAFRNYKYCIKKGLNWKEYLRIDLEKKISPTKSFLYQFMGHGPITTTELKKALIRSGVAQTARSAERKIKNWLEIEEIYKVSNAERDFMVSLTPVSEQTL